MQNISQDVGNPGPGLEQAHVWRG